MKRVFVGGPFHGEVHEVAQNAVVMPVVDLSGGPETAATITAAYTLRRWVCQITTTGPAYRIGAMVWDEIAIGDAGTDAAANALVRDALAAAWMRENGQVI
jgi:hypothetical protein